MAIFPKIIALQGVMVLVRNSHEFVTLKCLCYEHKLYLILLVQRIDQDLYYMF